MEKTAADKQWQQALSLISRQISPEQFSTWFSNVDLIDFGPDRVELGVANRFIKEWLQGNYADILTSAVSEVSGAEPEISIKISAPLFREMRARQDLELDVPSARQARKRPVRSDVNPDMSLQRFVVGPGNRLAYAAAQSVAEGPAETYNPLFLFGDHGLGKTHLLQGICRHLRDSSGKTALYAPCETFVNGFIGAIQSGTLESFRSHFRSPDVLIIDDIQFLASKRRTQEEFFHTFDAIRNMGGQVILACDSHPKEIDAFQDRLVARFVSGLIVELHTPDVDTRSAIVRAKAAGRGLDVPSEVVGYVAEHVTTNIREIEGAVTKLAAISHTTGSPPDMAAAHRALRHFGRSRTRRPGLKAVASAVAERLEVELTKVRSRSRARELTTARHVGMFLSAELTDASLSEIGRFYGGRNHATVIHAKKKVAALKKDDPDMARMLADLTRRLER